jgi:aspartate/methionine/tyrosine aminotransferase
MKFKLFLLDQWLEEHAEPPVEFDLAPSTGPHWKLRELLALASEDAPERLLDTKVIYSRAEGKGSLREAIAQMQGVPAEQVLVTAGGAEALFHIFSLAAEPGANVLVPFPSFPPNHSTPEALGLEVRSYHLRPENSYRVDLDDVKRLTDAKTKLILVNSPHNPTGATLSDAEMSSLHDFATERGIQFVSDEVYHPIYHGPETASAARLPYATVVGDFSKAFSLGGLRLGWVIERDARRRAQYLNAREHLTISNSPVTEFCAEVAVRHRDKILSRTREVAGMNLQLLDRLIAEHSDVLDWVRPKGGMTGFPQLVSGEDACTFCLAAVRKGLLFAPGDCFGVHDHFRVGFGVSQEWFPRAMQRFAEFLHSWARAPQASMTA